ncbi:putative ribonuclease H-like domain-containing protein [Tanacetum coccineum]
MELEKVVKERDGLKDKIAKWKESSKNLDEILNSQMSARDKTDGYHAVPPPITGNFLTPRADISFAGLDEYAIRKKIIESKTTELNTDTSKSKTSETVGKTNEVNIEKPKSVHESVVPKPKINRDKVIIEDWNSDDEDDVSAVKTVSPVKTNETQTVRNRVDKIDCDFYDKKSPEPKLKTVVNAGQTRVLTRTSLVNPVRTNGKRVVHTVSTARPISTARSISTARPVSTARKFALKIAQRRSYYTKPAFRPKTLKQDVKTSGVKNMTNAGTRAVVNTGKGKMDNDLKKSRWVWRPKGNYMDHESKEKGSFILKKFEYGNPKSIQQDHAVVDSGCSSHMTGNKAYLSDYKDYNGGFMAFGSDPKGENQVNVDAGTQEHYVAGSSEKDKKPTQEYILLPLHPHRPRISVEDVFQAAQEKPSKNSSKDNDVHDSKYVAEKEEQHTLKEAEQALKDDIERMIAQETAAKAIDDAIRQAFKEEKKRAAQATSINKLNTGRPSVSTSNSPLVNTASTPYASAASTSIGANTGGSSFFYLGGQIPIDASTLPNANLPIDPNMPDLEDDSNVFPNDGIFSGAYDDEDVGAEANFNNMDNKIIRSDHGTKFKNHAMNELCKPPSISFMRPFGCPLTILNTLDPLGKFDRKSDEGYLLGYSTSSKAFRVYNKRTKRVEENMHIDFLEDQPNVAGSGPD